MFHLLLDTTTPIDWSHWSPRTVEALIERVLELVTAVGAILAYVKAHRAEKRTETNKQSIETSNTELRKDIRSVNEQITMVAKDVIPAPLAVPILEASKTLEESLDTLKGQ